MTNSTARSPREHPDRIQEIRKESNDYPTQYYSREEQTRSKPNPME
jgi:hypothetical protein